MALRKVQGSAIADNAITSAKIASGAVTAADLNNDVNTVINNVTVDTVFTGDSITIPAGTTAERPASPTAGMIRYNSTTGLVEQYNNSGWQGIDAAPTVLSVSGVLNEDTTTTLTINGANFKPGSVVYIEGAAVGGIPRALVTTYVNSTQITASSNASSVSYVGAAAFNVKVANPSGLAATLDNAGYVDRDPIWSAPISSSIIDTYDRVKGAQYSKYTNNGTTYRVITFKGGAGTWVSPITGNADILIVGGGGGGGIQVGGGGGAGSVLYGTNIALTAGQSYNYQVGSGGMGGGFTSDNGYPDGSGTPGTYQPSSNGFPSYLGSWIAAGGGGGGSHNDGIRFGANASAENGSGKNGGSGGGGAGNSASIAKGGGTGLQTGYSGFTAYVNNGGTGRATQWAGGGGGGAGGAGQDANTSSYSGGTGGNGGIGVAFDITGTSTYYGGGGGGCWSEDYGPTASIQGGGGRGVGNRTQPAFGTNYGEDGQPNTGGGGGGCRDRTGPSNNGNFVTRAGNGGSGIIVIRYNISLENNTFIDLDATDPDGNTVTYSTSSTLPTGVTISNDLVGFAESVSSTTTYPMTINATANGQTESRSFSIIVNKAMDGSSSDRAASSASAIKTLTGTSINGIYWINVNGVPTEVNCDMTTDGGGWMQGMNVNTRDGHIVHYVNNDFWESTTETTSFYSAAAGVRSVPTSRPNGQSEWLQDWKAIHQGNLWANYAGNKLLVVVHTNGTYLGWRSWYLNTSTVTKFSQFWTGGSTMYSSSYNPSNNNVYWQRKITNGQINISAGSLASGEPLIKNGVDLVANAQNYNRDLNRLTITTSANGGNTMSTGGYPVGDNAGGGLGTYYDADTQGRPECDAQIFYTGTWGNGRIGSDYLDNSNYTSWNGKSIGSTTDTYQWNSGSGLNYDYAFFIK